MMSKDGILKILPTYVSAKNENKELLNYSLNIIDTLHADENGHTRILVKILDYENNNSEKLFLKKFIDLLNERLEEKFYISKNASFKNHEQYNYIDAYIDSNKDAIIIENKINGAKDQDFQLENYINVAKKDHENEQIFVVYLTENGIKKPDDKSLTPYAKTILDYNNKSKGRFIEINYKYHILPFLKGCLSEIHENKIDEPILKSALCQYIDYLEGRFHVRESERRYEVKMEDEILKALSIDKLNGRDRANAISSIENDILNILENIKNNPKKEKAKELKKIYDGNKEKYLPFDSVELWEDVAVVFHNYCLDGDHYKLDVFVDYDKFLLTLKREDDDVEKMKENTITFKQQYNYEVPKSKTIAFMENEIEKLDEELSSLFSKLTSFQKRN